MRPSSHRSLELERVAMKDSVGEKVKGGGVRPSSQRSLELQTVDSRQ